MGKRERKERDKRGRREREGKRERKERDKRGQVRVVQD